VVTSRAFRVRGPSHPAAMLPLIDLCNHSFRPNCEVKPSGQGGVQLLSLRQLLPGEPLLINYGSLPNDFLLMDYGFLVEDNPHDTVQLRFDLSLVEVGCFCALPSPWALLTYQELLCALCMTGACQRAVAICTNIRRSYLLFLFVLLVRYFGLETVVDFALSFSNEQY
jgi:hypothetical protein